MSFGIRGENLEAEGWSDEEEDDEDDDEEEEIGDDRHDMNEHSGLLRK